MRDEKIKKKIKVKTLICFFIVKQPVLVRNINL